MVPTEGMRFRSTPDCSTALGRLGEGLCHNHRPHSIQETRRYGLLDDRLPAIFVHFPPHPSFHLTSPRVAVIGWSRSNHLPLIRGVVIVWFIIGLHVHDFARSGGGFACWSAWSVSYRPRSHSSFQATDVTQGPPCGAGPAVGSLQTR